MLKRENELRLGKQYLLDLEKELELYQKTIDHTKPPVVFNTIQKKTKGKS